MLVKSIEYQKITKRHSALMRIILFILLTILFSFQTKAQFEFPVDTANHLYIDQDFAIIDSVYHVEKDFDFQLRCSRDASLKGKDWFIMTCKKGVWKAQYFENRSLYPKKWVEVPIFGNIDTLWTQLVECRILDIKSFNYNNEGIFDGVGWTIQIINQKGHKTYGYYALNCSQYQEPILTSLDAKRVCAILKLIYTFCHQVKR